MDVDFIPFYLPQFHPIPENDEWWGKGFTEWTNLAKAKKLFWGHDQPLVPSDLGFYDLRLSESRVEQARLAKEHGIAAFCYWHYWFGDHRRILERPFKEVVSSGEPDLPFCLGWANQTWSGIWHGDSKRILMEQKYPGPEDFSNHFYALLPAFKDERYYKVGERPLFVIYRPQELPDGAQFVELWNKLALKNGLPEFYFVGCRMAHDDPNYDYGYFDATTMLRPTFKDWYGTIIFRALLNNPLYKLTPKLHSYKKASKNAFENEHLFDSDLPCVFSGWDNTPRSGKLGHVYLKPSPEKFAEQIEKAIGALETRSAEEKIVFVRSWNEWAEGNVLEPSFRYKDDYLKVIQRFKSGDA